MELVSGAGHDAIYMAGVCPTGMIFVPAGWHQPQRDRGCQALRPAAGCNVLLQAMLERAGVA